MTDYSDISDEGIKDIWLNLLREERKILDAIAGLDKQLWTTRNAIDLINAEAKARGIGQKHKY